MTRRIENGHYEVETQSIDKSQKGKMITKKACVIRGDVANDIRGQVGFSSSKWYAYIITHTEVEPRLEFSPTAPSSAFTVGASEYLWVGEEFSSKKDAVSFVEDKVVNLDRGGEIRSIRLPRNY